MKLLDELWFSYINATAEKNSEKEQEIISTLIKHEYDLQATLNEEQKNLLKIYDENLSELYCLLEKEAFIKGIRFATKYLIDACF